MESKQQFVSLVKYRSWYSALQTLHGFVLCTHSTHPSVPSDFTFEVHLRIENKRIIIRSLRTIKNVKFRRVKRDFLSGNAKPLISDTRAYDVIIDTHLVRARTRTCR